MAGNFFEIERSVKSSFLEQEVFMIIDYCGWKKDFGNFKCEIFVDENRTDYKLIYKNGMVASQESAFSNVTADWNHDGDIYTRFGAYFTFKDRDGNICGRDFFTPVEMVRVLIDAKGIPVSRLRDIDVVDIPGIIIPPLKKHPSLAEQLRVSEKRSEKMEIERNRKMKLLGIRHLNEPWAR